MTAPAAAASGDPSVEVGAFQLTGTCGLRSIVGPGFLLRAAPSAPLPVGTSVTVFGSGVADSGVFRATPDIAQVVVLSGTARLITLVSELGADTTVAFRTSLPIDRFFRLQAAASLPDGYTGSGAKSSASFVSDVRACTPT